MGKGKLGRRVSALCLLIALSFYPLPVTLSPISFPLRSVPVPLFPRFPFPPVSDAILVSTSTREGRLAVFDDVWARIDERYYDQTFNGVDWEATRTTFRSLAADAHSSQELYAVLRGMIAPLNDPHTRVFAPDEKYDWWRPRFVSAGFSIAEIAGMPTVIRVDRNSPPQRAGMRAGDLIETVNGAKALSLVESRLASLTNPASASARLRIFGKLLDGPSGTGVDVTWKGKDGKQKSARFERTWQQRELGVRMHRERGEYVVIEIDAFTKSIAASFARSLKKKLNGARGVILDLRANGGGDAEAMSDIASTFLGIGTNLGQFTDRAGTSFTISTHLRSLLTPDPLTQTKLPLTVLTSERTASAAEIFVEALRISGRATIIGSETCGCVLAVRNRHLLPDGGLLDVSELDYQTAQGHRLEGHGLKPDEMVTIERNDLYAGRDRAMELAVSKLIRIPIAITQ
ncbi:MAG TPA: S41 family peptidase [Pyrinomonadaceae bacterium]|jgi:carboxyl-terminal processing protease|nr:S41 family peptidase [Pyrinomonadaceae bacterium]